MEAPWKNVWPEWSCIRRLGEGSCGTVFEAARPDGERAAIKLIRIPRREAEIDLLRSEGMGDDEIRQYLDEKLQELLAEVRNARELSYHPNIVRVEDFAQEAGEEGPSRTLFIRMELLTPLLSYLADRTLPQTEIVRLGCELCEALSACHGKKLLHRDIKPENIFVDDEGHFKLGDFGISRRMDSGLTYLTSVGTPLYIAPEVYAAHDYDGRADLYSLGLVLYRFFNRNRLPFMSDKRLSSPADRQRALEWRLRGEELPPPADAPARLAEVILKACAFRPQNRFETAEAFREALLGKKARPALGKYIITLAAGGLFLLALLLPVTGMFGPAQTATEESGVAFSESPSPDETSGAVPTLSPETEVSSETASRTETRQAFTSPEADEGEPSRPSSLPEETQTPFPSYFREAEDGTILYSLSSDGSFYRLTDLWETVFTGDLHLPELFNGKPVEEIAAGALEYLSLYGGDLSLPHTVTELGAYTVSDCYVEGKVIVPGNIRTISTKAFYQSDCGTLEIQAGCEEIKDRAFENLTAGRLIIPASVKTMAGALCKTSHIQVLEIHSQAVLDEWLAGEAIFFSPIGEIILGEEIRDYYIENGCVIHRPTRSLVRTFGLFEIPAGGKVERIVPCAVYMSQEERADHPLLDIPEGVRVIEEKAINLDWDIHVFNWETQAFVRLPSTLESIDPEAFVCACVAAYPKTKEKWMALAARTEGGAEDVWFGSSSVFWVYCTDGKLRADWNGTSSEWRALYDE